LSFCRDFEWRRVVAAESRRSGESSQRRVVAVEDAACEGDEGGKTGISDVLLPLVKVSLHGEATSMFDVDLRG